MADPKLPTPEEIKEQANKPDPAKPSEESQEEGQKYDGGEIPKQQ